MSEFVVVTGLSGAGRSHAGNNLEDLGWFVIDNLPPELIPRVAELAQRPGSSADRVALVVGSSQHGDIADAVQTLKDTGAVVRVLFLDAPTEVLVRRYEETRRRHPLGDTDRLTEAIELERGLLEPVKDASDIIIDTGRLNVHQLRSRVVELVAGENSDQLMTVRVSSFGYRYGLPSDVDMVFDCRFLPNPHWDEDLRPFTGLDEPVRRYVLDNDLTTEYLQRIEALLDLVIPAAAEEGKSYLSVALGCTGGRHRSVALAEEVGRRLKEKGHDPIIHHQDLAD
jgi:UPF0042 nucleotide-binding protein